MVIKEAYLGQMWQSRQICKTKTSAGRAKLIWRSSKKRRAFMNMSWTDRERQLFIKGWRVIACDFTRIFSLFCKRSPEASLLKDIAKNRPLLRHLSIVLNSTGKTRRIPRRNEKVPVPMTWQPVGAQHAQGILNKVPTCTPKPHWAASGISGSSSDHIIILPAIRRNSGVWPPAAAARKSPAPVNSPAARGWWLQLPPLRSRSLGDREWQPRSTLGSSVEESTMNSQSLTTDALKATSCVLQMALATLFTASEERRNRRLGVKDAHIGLHPFSRKAGMLFCNII